MLKLSAILISAVLPFSVLASEPKPLNASPLVGHGKSTLYCAQDLAKKIIQTSPASKDKEIHVQATTTVFGQVRSDKRAIGPANVKITGTIGGVPFEGDMTFTFYNEFDSDHNITVSKCHVETGRLESEHVFEIKERASHKVLITATYDKEQCPIQQIGIIDEFTLELKAILKRIN